MDPELYITGWTQSYKEKQLLTPGQQHESVILMQGKQNKTKKKTHYSFKKLNPAPLNISDMCLEERTNYTSWGFSPKLRVEDVVLKYFMQSARNLAVQLHSEPPVNTLNPAVVGQVTLQLTNERCCVQSTTLG